MGRVVKLHLGVIDLPYAGAGTSTGDVAEILESRYDVMGDFAALHLPGIAESMAISVSEAIDSLLQGAPATIDPFAGAMADIKKSFTQYLDDEEIVQTGQAGVPTQAALDGVRTSLKKKKEIKGAKYRSRIRGTRRPSFVDTQAYRNSFIPWVE